MKSSCIALCVLVTVVTGSAQEKPASSSLPPLIDRELFFGNPEIASAALSPDGKFIAFRKPWNGTMNIWVKKAEEPFDSAKRLTADTRRPIPAFFWSRDSKYILFVQDQAGDENFNVYAVDPSAAAAAGQEVPAARNLTDAKGVRAAIYDVPRESADLIHVGLNDRDAAWHDLYEVRISTGERKLLRKNTDKIAAWVFDRAGKLRLAMRTTDAGDTDILRVTDTGFEQVYPAPSSRRADRCSSTRTTPAFTWSDNKGDAGPHSARPLQSADEEGRGRGQRSGETGGFQRRYLFGKDRRAGRNDLHRRYARGSTSATRISPPTSSASSRSCPASR